MEFYSTILFDYDSCQLIEVRGQMGRDERKQLIASIERVRNSRLVCYVTGDRKNHETKISTDVFPFLYEHLLAIGQVESIDLFLYTTGGDSIGGWGLVNLVREFCNKMSVIIPARALSCGTLIALGANELIMGKLGQVSPLDPSVSSPYNPQAPGQQQLGRMTLLPVSVEDMMGYLNLAKEELGLKGEEAIASVVRALSDQVHPLAIGAAYRARQQGSLLATHLLRRHTSDEQKVDKIVTYLTKDLPTHNYLIGRTEAKDVVGLNIIDVPAALEGTIWELYREYENWLELRTPYNAEAILGPNPTAIGTFPRAALESLHDDQLKTHVFRTEKEVRRVQVTQPGIPVPISGVQERIINEGWIEESL